MQFEYKGLSGINGPLVVVDGVRGVGYEEVCEIKLDDGTKKLGRVIEITGDKAIVQVFEGTIGLSMNNTRTKFAGKPMELGVSKEIIGRVFNGSGEPIDGLGPVFAEKYVDVNGLPINPVCRRYPRNYIHTGISSIDALMTLIRGQKLPVFSGSGMSHNKLAAQIVRQARLGSEGEFGIVFGSMGIKHDVSQYFLQQFREAGVLSRVVMFQNLSNDPIAERIMIPRLALTAAEYLAFECGMHILVILTDMTSYAEALRELSSSKNEIPGRKDLWHESRGLVMGVYKEGKNWKVQVYYKDWQGNRKRKQKRGFRTKGEAKEWEKDFLQQQSQGVDIEFGNFLEIYYKDMDVYNPFQSRK